MLTALKMVLVSFWHWTVKETAGSSAFVDCIGNSGKDGFKFLVNDRVKEGECSLQVPPVTDEDMDTLCSDFCGEKAIPFLVGSTAFGFNLTQADDLCDDPIKAEVSKVSECRGWAEQLNSINEAAADFVASMRILTYEQLKYKAAVTDQVEKLEEKITSPDTGKEVLRTRKVEDRIATLKTILASNLQDLLATGIIQQPVTDQMGKVKEKAANLKEKLKNIDDLEKFVTQCNELYLGIGPENEYLLNICAQSGDQCINAEFGRHVSCCCGVVPAAGMYGIAAKNAGLRLLKRIMIKTQF